MSRWAQRASFNLQIIRGHKTPTQSTTTTTTTTTTTNKQTKRTTGGGGDLKGHGPEHTIHSVTIQFFYF